MKLACNKQGNHILKSLLKSFKSSAIKVLTSFLLNNFEQLSRNVYGISIIKKLIEYVNNNKIKSLKSKIKQIISNSYQTFVLHEYAHYAILHIIDIWGIKSSEFIIKKATSFELIVLKYNSRIIYKIIDSLSYVSIIYIILLIGIKTRFLYGIFRKGS